MNRKLTSLILTAFITVLSTALANAQLSGTYTIGGASPDYPTVVDAVTDLSTNGVAGPVIFNIRDGVYTGKLVFNAIAGTSLTNTVTFQSENGDSSLVTITSPTSGSSATNYTVSLTNTDYITFSKVTLERSGALAYSHVIELSGGNDYNNFNNCVITCGPVTGTAAFQALVYSAVSTADNYNVFNSCRVENGSFGFYLYGTSAAVPESGNMIMNCQVLNQTNYGIQVGNAMEFMAQGNYITGISTSYGSAIYLSNISGNSLAIDNKINLPEGGTGISLSQSNAGAGNEIIIANNFVYISNSVTTTQAYGIRVNTCVNTGVYYNNVNIKATVAVANNYAFNAAGTCTNLKAMNNVFVANTGYVVGNAVGALTVMNHNDLFKTGANNFATVGTTNYANFNAWVAATNFDTNSVNIDPLYISNTDLHIQTFALNAMAVPVTAITTDIDGDLRDVATPDIGADETSPPSNDVGVVKLVRPYQGSCGSTATEVVAIVRNYAAVPQSNVTVVAEISGTQTATLTGTIAGPIDVYKSDTVYFTPTINTYLGDSLVIKMYTTIANDEDNTNDTLEVDSVYINPIPAPPSVPTNVSTCLGSSASVNATYPANHDVFWFTTPTGGLPIANGSPLVVSPSDTTIYYAEIRDTTIVGGGCLRITEVELNDVSTGGGDYIEIQNLSAGLIDATGWVVASSDSYTDINIVNAVTWPLDVFNPSETKIRYDANTGPNYWGSNLLYTGGQPGWVMIVDAQGQVVDFIAWQWTLTDIQNMNVTVNGFPISIGNSWASSSGAPSCSSGSISRIGGADTDTDTDWACETQTENATNANIQPVFTGCGSGSCPSDRVAVQVDVILPTPISLGNDTTIAAPNTVTLDPGAGFTTYLWSTGETTQTIVVNASGNYTVTVTDANGCTSTDVITIIVLTGINDFGANSQIVLSPVPAHDYLQVTFKNMTADNYAVSLLNNLGQYISTATIDIASATAEQKFDLTGIQKGIYYIEVKSEKGISRHRVLIQ